MRYCVANWKMNFNIQDSLNFVRNLCKNNLENPNISVILCPPFTSIKDLKGKISKAPIQVGAQNVHQESKGSFTGEVSASMLKEIECDWVILGHSERRQYYNEEDVILNDKLNTVLRSGLNPILCIGESLNQRKNGETFPVLKHQLNTALSNIDIGKDQMLIAYEPVWAIGSGMSATVNIISEVVQYLKEYLMQNFSLNIPILYGGSVSEKNSLPIIDINGIDGFLIGGASLDINEFYSIYLNMIER